jgi:hypothetical protein
MGVCTGCEAVVEGAPPCSGVERPLVEVGERAGDMSDRIGQTSGMSGASPQEYNSWPLRHSLDRHS